MKFQLKTSENENFPNTIINLWKLYLYYRRQTYFLSFIRPHIQSTSEVFLYSRVDIRDPPSYQSRGLPIYQDRSLYSSPTLKSTSEVFPYTRPLYKIRAPKKFLYYSRRCSFILESISEVFLYSIVELPRLHIHYGRRSMP